MPRSYHRSARSPRRTSAPAQLLVVAVATLVVAGFAHADEAPESVAAALEKYESDGRALLSLIESETPAPELSEHAAALTRLAETLAGEFAIAYPACGPHLGAALGVLQKLDSISVDEIERSYHADDELPEAPGFCYHPRDLVVHPATVIVLARNDSASARRQMLAEMLEVLAHVGATSQLFELAGQGKPPEIAH